MSDEEIYQRIGELEKQIAELRRNLPTIANWKPPKLVEGKSLSEQKKGDPFRIRSEAELKLDNLPNLAHLILDALPIQIYIKNADIEKRRNARPYTYLNNAVIDLYGWSREEAKTKCDRDVFAKGKRGDQLHEQMRLQEGETIEEQESRITRTAWNKSGGYWSRNENIEIPILDQKGVCIGFCSLAQNHDFEEASRLLAIYQQKARHRVYHLISTTTSDFTFARKDLTQYCETHPEAGALNSVITALDHIRHELRLFNTSSKLQIEAWDSMGRPPETGTLRHIIDDLQEAYNECGFQLVIHAPAEIDIDKRVLQPQTVKAILSIFIGNAVGKHQPRPKERVKECTLACIVTHDEIKWTVSNPCRTDAKAYTVPDEAPTSLKEAMEEGFDKLMLAQFVLNSSPAWKPSRMIHTSRSVEPPRFTASLDMEVAQSA